MIFRDCSRDLFPWGGGGGFTREISSRDPGTSSSLCRVRALMLFTRFRRDEIHQKMHVNTSSRDEIVKVVDKIAVTSANCLLSIQTPSFYTFSPSSTLFEQSSFRVIIRKTRKNIFHPGMKLLI